MTYENAFLFGKNASIINEAYSKMYSNSKRGRRIKTVNEASDDGPSDNELRKMELSKEQRDYINNFDEDKEYKEISDAERKGNEDFDSDITPSDRTYEQPSQNVDDEEAEEFVSSFNSKSDRDAGQYGSDDFIFSQSRYADQLKKRYPEWLIKAAEAAGHKLPVLGAEPTTYKGRGLKKNSSMQGGSGASKGNEDAGTPWDNLWENVIVANPDVFNDENYDMEELPKHKKEFRDKWEQYFMKSADAIDAAKRALEEIPGCESKVTVDGYVGNIDGDDTETEEVDAETETVPFKHAWDREGFGVVVKSYDRVYNPGGKVKVAIHYITPPQLKGVIFKTKDEAIDALREVMSEFVNDSTDVVIGVVLDHTITSRIFNGEEYEVMKDADGNVITFTGGPLAGRPRRKRIDSTVYTISSSDAENTNRAIAYETNDWKNFHSCDEYLQ